MKETVGINAHLSDLKQALNLLPPTGTNGFEGLLGAVLGAIVGIPFRLSGGGSQFGIDGQTIYTPPGISFESKLYTDTISSPNVMAKIGELAADSRDTELWILAATSQIPNQLAYKVSAFSSTSVISTLILDWSPNALSPLPVVLSMASEETQRFLDQHPNTRHLTQKVATALEAIQNHDQFSTLATQLTQMLFAPTLGMDASREANRKWLHAAFGDIQKAREKFGQPLSPFDPAKGQSYVRHELIDRVHQTLNWTGETRPLYVLGDEGTGKSWLVAQSWSCLDTTPLFLLLTSDLFPNSATSIDVQEILISALIRQTGDYEHKGLREKWSNILQRWRNSRIDHPRIVVLIDGLNQSRKKDWARIVASFCTEVVKLSGRLVVTVRTQFYRSYIERRSPVEENVLEVAEWTASERDHILERRCIIGSRLSANVAKALRNPRLLGIALELLTNEEIVGLEELSVSRLLFEHILAAEVDFTTPQPAHEFVAQLRRHAEEILARVSDNHSDDLTVFDDDFQDQLQNVVDGRFFHQVNGDATRYTLDDPGLTLALGFAVVDRLNQAQRNGRCMHQTLEAIAEPIAALDLTASVFAAAFMTASLSEAYDSKSAVVLLEQISNLQNAVEDELYQIGYLARLRPHVFCEAAYNLCIKSGQKPSYELVVAPLIYASSEESLWLEMSETVKGWLSIYSISPDRGLFRPSNQEEREHYEKKYAENQETTNRAIAELSEIEQSILSGLRRVDGNPNTLSTLAFALLVGKPLEQMAPVIVKWSFASALVSDYMVPYRELHHLVRLNELDWRPTREALLREADVLREKDISPVGQRTIMAILAATGGLQDAKEAFLLSEALRGNHEPTAPWRLVEDYCASDPCDPASKRPENIDQTAQDYATIDVSKVKVPNGNAPVGVFLDRARAAMARFEPVIAVEKHRAFAYDVVRRSGLSLYHGAFELRPHNALVGRDNALRFVESLPWAVLEGNESTQKGIRLTRQLCLALACPFLTAQEQFEVLQSVELEEILLDLLSAIKPLDSECFDNFLHTAYLDHDEAKLYLLLLVANRTCLPISDVSRNVVMALLSSESDRVRSEALGVVAQVGEKSAVRRVAHSDWQATGTTRIDEIRFGSLILIEAVVFGLINAGEALSRISPTFYTAAAKRWSENGLREAVQVAGSCMDAAIRTIVEFRDEIDAPDIQLHVGYSDDEVPVVNFEGRDVDLDDPVAGLRLASETDEQRLYRHKKNWAAFRALKDQLRDHGCDVILDQSNLDGLRALVESDAKLARNWFESLNAIGDDKLGQVHNIVLQVACSLSNRAPSHAAILFQKVWSSKPLVRIVYGSAELSLDSMALWAGSDAEQLNHLRILRLEQATSDKDLSEQVLAAHVNGKQELLERFICLKIDADEPTAIARAVMVAGLSDCSAFNRRLLKRFEDSHGYIGKAYGTAQYSYERNEWARHWYDEMCKAETEQEFWRFSVLFLKVVDGRYDYWKKEYDAMDGSSVLFLRSLSSRVKHRVNKWNSLREKKLFGDDIPRGIFSYFIGKTQDEESE